MTKQRYRLLVAVCAAACLLWAPATLGQSDPVVEAFNRGQALYKVGEYDKALPKMQQALKLSEQNYGPEHRNTTLILNYLGLITRKLDDFPQAEIYLSRALEIRQRTLEPNHYQIAVSLNNLALLYQDNAKFEKALELYQRSVPIMRKAKGPDHSETGLVIGNIANMYRDLGRLDEAEREQLRSLAIREKALGSDHVQVSHAVNNLAYIYVDQGRYGEVEKAYKRALNIQSATWRPDHPGIASTLNNLGRVYRLQARLDEAETLYKRALAIWEKAKGPSSLSASIAINNLAVVYTRRGKFEEAIALHERSLAIKEKALGPDHPDVAGAMQNLAENYKHLKQYAKAEELDKRSLAIREMALGPEHTYVADSLNNMGNVYAEQSRYAEALTLYDRAIAIRDKLHGPNHIVTAGDLENVALAHEGLGDLGKAHAATHRATSIYRTRAAKAGGAVSGGTQGECRGLKGLFFLHVHNALGLAIQDPPQRDALHSEAFEVAQFTSDTTTAGAVARMAARFATGDDALAVLVRKRQDAVDDWRRTDTELIDAVASTKRNRREEERLRAELARLDSAVSEADSQLASTFPDYTALASPQPLSIAEVQPLMAPNEALITWLLGDEESFMWVVRGDRSAAHILPVTTDELTAAIQALRQSLDPTGIVRLEDIPRFSTTQAFKLYQQLFAPAEPLLEGVQHVIAVPSGALSSLPVGVLVTEAPQRATTEFADYRDVPWLAKRYALTVLPSVASLKALRLFASRARASSPFIGFGDPALQGQPGGSRSLVASALFKQRGGVADADEVRQLPRLPETADELRALARSLGAAPTQLYLGDKASESVVKRTDLSRYRVLAFATHGLMAGDFDAVGEPAFVMTPPRRATASNDGLLTAGEVAQLKLNADWVILSACNTAAPDGTPGADGLSGLTRAFFYAGSRALLVSHWPVESEAAKRLTTRLFEVAAVDPKISRADALRRSMLELMQTEDRPHYAHPMFWAPFIVVGAGGAAMGG